MEPDRSALAAGSTTVWGAWLGWVANLVLPGAGVLVPSPVLSKVTPLSKPIDFNRVGRVELC